MNQTGSYPRLTSDGENHLLLTWEKQGKRPKPEYRYSIGTLYQSSEVQGDKISWQQPKLLKLDNYIVGQKLNQNGTINYQTINDNSKIESYQVSLLNSSQQVTFNLVRSLTVAKDAHSCPRYMVWSRRIRV